MRDLAPNDACPECLRLEFLGFTAKGPAVTTVGFSLTGQDANYEGERPHAGGDRRPLRPGRGDP